jgi:hypothetical protein
LLEEINWKTYKYTIRKLRFVGSSSAKMISHFCAVCQLHPRCGCLSLNN